MGNDADFAFSGDSGRDRDRLPVDPSVSTSLSGLLCAVCEQDGDSILNRIPALALCAANRIGFEN